MKKSTKLYIFSINFTCIVLLCILPIISLAQTLTFTSTNPSVPVANQNLGSTNQIIYQASFVENVNYGVNINSLTFTPTGTFVTSDINKYLFYWSNTNLFSGATLAANPVSASASGNAVTIPIWNPWIPVGQTCYFWITADISSTAVSGHTLTVGALTKNSLIFSPNVATAGTMYAGGTQTFLDLSLEQFRSINSGNWNVNSTWQQSIDGGSTWVAATSTPTSSNGLVTIQSGNTVTLNASAGARNLLINGSLDLSTFALTGTGTLTASSTGILLVGGTSNFPTGFTTNTLSLGSLVKYYMTGNQTISGQTFSNLTLSGSGIKTTTGITVNGTLSMEGTSTVSTMPTYGSAATLQYNTVTPRTAGAEWITPFAATGGVVITNTGTITMDFAKVFNASIPIMINANASLATNNLQLTLGGNFTNAGTFNAGNSPIVITNTMTSQSISGFTTTGNVSMTKTAGIATLQSNLAVTSLTVNGTGGTLHLGTGLNHIFSGAITLTAGTLNGGSSVLNENATSATAWNGTGSLFTAGTGTVVFGGAAQTLATASTFYTLIFTNSGLKTLSGVPTINNLLSLEGIATISGTPVYGSAATLQYKGNAAQITGNEFVNPFTGSGGVKINNSNGVTLGSARSLGTNPFTIGNLILNSQFSDGGFLLTATGTLNLTSGYYSVKSASFPAFTTTNIAAGTTVDYAATATQTVKGITYSNMNISGTGNNSKKADGNITVNGILNLISVNYSSTQGCLDMNSTPYTLNMGATATTTGTGDVTGIVTRTSFTTNTSYTFGNQFTTINMQAGGTLPSSLSVKIFLTSTHSWKSNAINRYYDIAQSGGTSGTLANLNLHYLPGELNGATESNLDLFDYHVSTLSLEDHGHSNINTTNQWVSLANQAINYIAPGTGYGITYWTLGTSTAPNFTWVGGSSTDWTNGSNWTGGIIPGTNDAVIIPNATGTTYDPILPSSTTVGSMNIQSGGILNGTIGIPTLTISGGTGAWNNLGTFNSGSSTVIFTNSAATMADPTNFYNVTVADGATLTLGTNNIMRIAGALSLSSTGILNAANNYNTVEYNGTNQTVILPNGSTPGYSYLILSGSGTKTLPSTAMTINGDLIMNGIASATAASALNVVGNVLLNSGTTFAASNFSHTVSGNWTNNGATFTPGTGTISFNNPLVDQVITGTSASQTFYNVISDKTANTLSVGGSTSTLTVNNFNENSGNFIAPANLTINGNITLTSGTLTAGSTSTTITGSATLTSGTYIAGTTSNLSGNWTNNGATFTAGNGTLNLNGLTVQTIGGSTSTTFNNLTVNNTAGVTATANQTVNGILNLPDANPSSTKGSLDMGSNTLYLGIVGTDTGIGDVTGTITHNHAFMINNSYTFGHPNTRFRFNDVPNGQTFPTSISVNVSIGSSLTWGVTPANALKRQFIITHTGGSGNSGVMRASYLDSELVSGTNESTLSIWSFIPGANILTDEGWSNFDDTQNFIALSDINFSLVPSPMYVGIAPTLNTRTWNGNISTDWNNAGNWTPNGVPTSVQGVIIPDAATTTFDPSLPIGATSQYMIIESGGLVNSATNASLQLNGSGNVWTSEPAITGLSAGQFNAGNSTVSILNTIGSTYLSGSTDFYNLSIGFGSLLRMNVGSYMGISGTLTNNGIMDARTNPNTVEFKGAGQLIPNPNFTIPGYNNLIINSTVSSPIWPDNLNIGGNFINNKNGLTETSTVVMDGSSVQTITGTATTVFNNLTINNSNGVNGSTNMTVNGDLMFISDNPVTNDKGALAMAASQTLDMGVNSTTTGPGEVTGIIRRTHIFATSTLYSFGDESTNVTFTSVSGQALPTSMSIKVDIGTAPDWSARLGAVVSNPIRRIYDITQTGASGTRALIQIHYKDNEIPVGIIETNLSIWSSNYVSGTYYNVEAGRSGINTNKEYLTMQDVDFANVPSVMGYNEVTLAPQSATNYTWVGTISTDWTNASNWTPNGVPGTTQGAIIPDTYTTTFAPTLPSTASCLTLQINAGGVLNAPSSGGTFTITGANGAWSIESGGTFNANTSNVLFNTDAATIGSVALIGATGFYNLSIASGTLVRPSDGSYTRISGTLLNNGTLEATTNDNTIEFNGNSTQSIPNPNGSTPGYHHLILSGSGTMNLPSTLNIFDEFSNNSTGTVNTGTGTVSFDKSSYNQLIDGFTSTLFYNLTVDNPTKTVLVKIPTGVSNTLNITTGSFVDLGVNALGGTIASTSGTGTIYTQNTSSTPISSGVSWSGTVSFNGTGGQTVCPGNYSSLQISNPAGTTASGIINSTLLTIDNGTTLDMGIFALTGGSTNSGTGTLKTQNTSTQPIPGGKTWTGTVDYNGSASQTLVAGIYGNISIDNPSGVALADSATVTGTLLINSGNNLVINTGAKMAAQQIINNADVSGITIQSNTSSPNGTLIFNNTFDKPVFATVEMYSKASWDLTNTTPGGKYKWQFFGIPVNTLTTSPMFDGDYVRQYNEAGTGSGYASTNHWIQLVNASSMTPFTGYEITQPAGRSYSFQGQLINRDFIQTLSYTTGTQYPGQHLLGNPYTAAINISQLSFGNDLDHTVYLYNTGSYADWSTQTGIDGNPGQYIAAPQSPAGTGGVPNQISSMQGFLIIMNTVTPTATTFSIPYSAVATRNNTPQRVRSSEKGTHMIYTRIDVSGSRFTDKMWIFTDPSCTHNYDNGWDGSKFLGSSLAPQIFAIENDGDYQVNSVDNINNTNIGFLAGVDSTYTLKFTHENTSSQYSSLYLLDLQENTSIDITQSGTTYSFIAKKTIQPVNRFKIITSTEITKNNSKPENKRLKIFNSNHTIIVQNSSNYSDNIIIYEVSGKMLSTVFMKANGITTIPTELSAGTYIVKGITSIDESDKLIIIP